MPDLLKSTNSGGRDRALTGAVNVRPSPSGRGDGGEGTSTLAERTPHLGPLPKGEEQEPIAVFDRVSKWYGPVIGLNEVSLQLLPGITGLVGPNGAGKSTMMRLATGQLRPDLGTVKVGGISAWRSAAKRRLGYCPESDTFYEEMSGRQFVRTMTLLFGYPSREAHERTDRAIELVGMADRCDRRIKGYSKGMRQRIKLAQSLVHDPQLLILDEPLNGIDPVGRADMDQLFHRLAELGKSILISSHQLEELERVTDRFLVIARGRLIAHGTLRQIRDLLEDHPLAVRIDSDRPRELAGALLRIPEVLGVELNGGQALIARAKNPHRFFQAFGALVLDDGFDIQHVETMDSSAQAILDYLMKDD